MAARHRLHAVAAAALTTAVLLARWWAIRALRGAHGASAARTPWRAAAPQQGGADTTGDRVAALHASSLDPTLRETDA
ncbi:hypothetical protein ACFWUZ_17535 [Streptomyces sp. NPDC058646]|uniref:hypothetical protein n=1 Tax=Streptomyces sp. NPDC058646 TaxID=3346574 RepID=UPI00366663E6